MKKRNRRLRLNIDRILSKSALKQLVILLVILLALFAISFIVLSIAGDDWKHYCDEKHISRWIFPLYLLIDANAFNDLYTDTDFVISKTTLLICGITFVAGILLFTGALISIMTNLISQRVENHRDGLIHYLMSGHYIIMGYDDMVPSVINEIFKKDKEAYVLLLTAVSAATIKEKLRKSFSENEMEHIVVNYGQRTSEDYYKDIHLEDAVEVYIIGRRQLPAHDAMNVECVDHICSYLKKTNPKQKPKRITCLFEDLDTYAAFKTTEIFSKVGDLDIEFVPYNFYTSWAKQVLLTQRYVEKNALDKPIAYPCVYGNGITENDPRFVHLVFVGTTNLAVAFAMEAAHMLHFPNYNEATQRPRTRITFIEKNAEQEMAQFMTRNRHLFEVQSYYYRDLSANTEAEMVPITDLLSKDFDQHDFLDVEFEFIKGDIYSKRVQDEIGRWANDKDGQYLSIFLAMADQRNNFMMGMNMPDEVYANKIPIFIRQDRSDNFVTNLRHTDTKEDDTKFNYSRMIDGELQTAKRHGRYAFIYPFGMNDVAYCSDEISLKRAKLVNFLYSTADYDNARFTDLAVLAAMGHDSIWDKAEKEWKTLTVALKWSNLYCAYCIPCKQASLRVMRGLAPNDTSHDLDELTPEEYNALALVEHNRWNVEKLLMGFRKAKTDEDKYAHADNAKALAKNKKLFIHHDIRPYSDLDIVKQYDIEISKYIPWILKMTQDKTTRL